MAKNLDNPEERMVVPHIIAKVKWYMNHPQASFIHPLIKVCATVFDGDSPASFIPVSRIGGRVAIAKSTLQFEYGEDVVIIAVPLLKTDISLH